MWMPKDKVMMMDVFRKTDSRKGDYASTEEIKTDGKSGYIRYEEIIFDTDKQIILTPFILESLENVLFDSKEHPLEDGTHKITAIAGIRENRGNVKPQIYYLGAIWEKENGPQIRQYFFRNDKPSSFNYGYLKGPGWPLNMSAFMVENAREHFKELENMRPNATRGLERCIELLSEPGPKYKAGDGSIILNLKQSG